MKARVLRASIRPFGLLLLVCCGGKPAHPVEPAVARLERPPYYVFTELDTELRIDPGERPCVVERPPLHGELRVDGVQWTYTPQQGYRGTDSFVCRGDDGDPMIVGVTVDRYAVPAVGETEPVSVAGDNADDIAIWVHPTDPARSRIVGTNNAFRGRGGILLYDLQGREVDAVYGRSINNVDVRYGFPLGGRRVDVAAASNRTDDTIAIFEIAPQGKLVSISEEPDGVAFRFADSRSNRAGVYGFCLYQSPLSGRMYGFITCKTGFVAQIELHESDRAPGRVTGTLVREFDVNVGEGDGTGDRFYIEACVADDVHRALYVSEEDRALWRYGAEPDSGAERQQVDRTGAGGHLVAAGDVEGLTIYRSSERAGYLIASNQGDNSFNIYDREGDRRFLTRFEIVDSDTADGVIDTDGIDVVGLALGGQLAEGLFVAQDFENSLPGSQGNQNFKMVRWSDIARAIEPNLAVRPDLSPR